MNYNNIQTVVFGQHCLNSLGQIRSLGEIGLAPDVVWVSHDFHSPKGSKNIHKFDEFETFEDALEFIESKYRLQKDVFIFTDSDAAISLLNSKIDFLPKNFHFFNAGSGGRLLKYMPKYAQCMLAERCGFNVPKSEIVLNGELPKTLNYPIFTKAPDSNGMSWKDSAMICRNKDELMQAFKKISTETILLQEYIDKDNEVAVEGLSLNAGDDVYVPIQGEYLRIQEGGFGTWKKNKAYELGDEFRKKLKEMMKEIRFSGVFEIEFLRDKNGALYFLEINFRFTQYNYALTRMGVNFCEEYIKSELDMSYMPKVLSINPQIVINDPKDFRTYVVTGKIKFKAWIKDMHSSDSYYLFNRADKLYVIRYLINSVYKRLKIRANNLLRKI